MNNMAIPFHEKRRYHSMTFDLQRHIELYAARREPYSIADGKLFRPYLGTIRPYGPICDDYKVSRSTASRLFRELGGWLVLSTTGFLAEEVGDYYAVICDRFVPLDEYKSKYRSEVRRGLKNCEVRRIDSDYVEKKGYALYVKAFERYAGDVQPHWTEHEFTDYVHISGQFDDIVHFWGVFCDGKLVTLAANNVFGNVEATYWMIKIDPDYLHAYPVYALIYKMNEFYLEEQHIGYVNDGWRSLRHETNVQDFLIKKFGFRRQHSRLEISYRTGVRAAVALAYPFRKPLSRLSSKAAGLLQLEEIRRACRK
jgi:hypothetical protein